MIDIAPLERAETTLTIDDTADGIWRVRRFELTESIARPYEAVVLAFCSDPDLDVAALLGADAELAIARGDSVRTVRGLVIRVAELGVDREGRLELELAIAPALALAEQRVDTRIFQNDAAPQCATGVLGDFLSSLGRTIVGRYSELHEPRDYCVQYRESDLAFARRLFEEDGLFYVFEQNEGEPERVLVLDDNRALPRFCALDGSDELELVEDQEELSSREVVLAFEWLTSLAATSVTRSDYDLAHPGAPVVHELRGKDARGHEREIYRHDERRWCVNDGNREAALELAAIDARRRRGRGRSNAVGLSAGTMFTLLGRGAMRDEQVIVTRVVHRGDHPEAEPGHEGRAAAPTYENRFECVPCDVPFRLVRSTHKPRSYGAETATVVGPEGEEIYPDELGRVKVAFHWDRHGSRNEHSSCWLRVAQTWAGNGFGQVIIPRIGMEVVVEFLAGNPDRPFVSGCLYNGLNGTPYSLPDEKTKTTLRTQSSPGGDGYNELTFEDSAGNEEVFLRAQRNLRELVGANRSETVGVDDTASVGRDRKTTIDRHESHDVRGDRARTVAGSESVKIAGSHSVVVDGGVPKGTGVPPLVSPGAEMIVTGAYTIDVTSQITIKCGASLITMTPVGITVATPLLALDGGGSTFSLSPGAAAMSSDSVAMTTAGGSELSMASGVKAKSGDSIKLQVDDSRLTLDGTARLRGPTVLVEGSSQLELSSDSDATLRAAQIVIEASATATMTSDAALELSAQMISSKSTGPHTIKGLPIHLNPPGGA